MNAIPKTERLNKTKVTFVLANMLNYRGEEDKILAFKLECNLFL